MSAQIYQRITDRIIALLEQGTIPWHKPWKGTLGIPRNLVTKREYRSINVFLLFAMHYESPFWLTFRQVTKLGGMVRKGEKACPVVFWRPFTVTDEETSEPKRWRMLRYYQVFNTSQCDGIDLAVSNQPEAERLARVIPKPEEIVQNMPQRPPIKHGLTHALCSPREDFVGMPRHERFDREEDYYSTLFHELVHSTGHQTRLNRQTLTEQRGYGSDPYCKEELVAEMGATFLSHRM